MLYTVFLFFLRIFYSLTFRIKFHGKENLPDKNASYIICSNHQSGHDIVFLAMLFKKFHIKFVAKEEITKNPFIRFFALRLGVIPIKRGTTDITAIKKAVAVLNDGGVLGIFPQGTRYRDIPPSPEQFKSGVAMIAHRAGADVVPVYIKTKNNRVRFFGKIDVYLGKTIPYNELGFEKGRASEYDGVTRGIAESIIALAPEKE